MKTAMEFFERIASDEAFAKEVDAALLAKREAGAASVYETVIPVAAEYGYEVTEDEVTAINRKVSEQVSDEDLGKVAGGTSCWIPGVLTTGIMVAFSIYATVEIIENPKQ